MALELEQSNLQDPFADAFLLSLLSRSSRTISDADSAAQDLGSFRTLFKSLLNIHCSELSMNTGSKEVLEQAQAIQKDTPKFLSLYLKDGDKAIVESAPHAAAPHAAVSAAGGRSAVDLIGCQSYLIYPMESVDFVNASAVTANINGIPVLNESNFKTWKNKVTIVLGCMELDLALREPRPAPLTDESSANDRRAFERWERSNRLSLMIMKNAIPETFLDTMSEETDAKRFLEILEKRYMKSDKAETSAVLRKLVSMRYKGNGNIREYILEMFNLAGKLKTLKLELSEDLLIHLVLISLPPQFSQFEVSNNCQKEKWTMNELISHLVQEEDRIKQHKTESAHLASSSYGQGKKRKTKDVAVKELQKKQKNTSEEYKEKKCFFCKDSSHFKKDCAKFHAWRVKKGLPELPTAK